MSAPSAIPTPGFPVYAAADIRRIESAAAALETASDALMQRAGLAGWRYLRACWPQAQRLVVVCGPGDNGGDGYVLAAHALAAGCRVSVLRLEAHAPRSALAQAACAGFEAAGGTVALFGDGLPEADVIVDALFGLGLSRAPDPATSALIDAVNRSGVPVLALDVPSGLCGDRGSTPGVCVRAARTLQLLAPRAGLRTGDGPDMAGVLALDTLDVAAGCFETAMPSARCLRAGDLAYWLRRRPRNSHKGRHGRVLCIGGDTGKGGAVMLAAGAALRAGAGLVEVATREQHVAPLLARWPEVMSCRTDNVDGLGNALQQADVIALGPGLGQGSWGHQLFDETLEFARSVQRPVVLDADALNLLAARPQALSAHSVLTPHPGEAARLLACGTGDIQRDRLAAVCALAERFQAVVVLKGAGSLVCASGMTPWLIAAGNPGMATGGMGDVLTGIIAALCAQGLDAGSAAACGALLHAVAGDVAAAAGGERGLLPADLIQVLQRCANPEFES